MKKTRRASLKNGRAKGKGQTKGKTLSASAGKTARSAASGSKRQERIPVRGASRSRVKPRAIGGEVSTRATASAAELDATRELAVAAMDAALDKQALAPILVDVSGMGSYTDFIGIVSGRSDRQVDAIAENVVHAMKQRGRHLLGQEGTGSGRWTLLDFGAFVIHVFHHPVREFYDLESLWIEAPRVKLDVPPEAVLSQPDALYGAL